MTKYNIVDENGSLVLTSYNLMHAHRSANVMSRQQGKTYRVLDTESGEFSDHESLIDLKLGGPSPLNRNIAKSHVPREDSVVASILRFLNGLQSCKAEKRQGTANQRSRPDIVGCISGRFFALEVKRGDEEATPGQMNELRQWAAAGAMAAVVYSVNDVKEVFDHFGIEYKSEKDLEAPV